MAALGVLPAVRQRRTKSLLGSASPPARRTCALISPSRRTSIECVGLAISASGRPAASADSLETRLELTVGWYWTSTGWPEAPRASGATAPIPALNPGGLERGPTVVGEQREWRASARTPPLHTA